MERLKAAADAVLARAIAGHAPLAGAAAAATDRQGNIYTGAAGRRMAGADPAFTPDTVCAIYSATKAITATACLQLVEDGRLDLDAPASRHAPDIAALQVIEGFDDAGNPVLRPPARAITTRMLLLHTAGFGYDFFNETCRRLTADRRHPPVASGRRAALMTPLLFDPGTRWEYGTGIDWAGQVVEGITGKRLGEVMAERIFAPLGMRDTGFAITPDMRARLARIHRRTGDGGLAPMPDAELPQDPEIQMGGHGLYSTTLDYMHFIRMWLNDGAGPGGRVLKAETVEMAARNGLGAKAIGPLRGVIPALSNDVDFFPGLPKGWALSFMVNEDTAPTGRAAGSLGWAGLANLYYWIDRRTGVGGFWASQLLPFADPTALAGALAFEAAVYAARAPDGRAQARLQPPIA